MVVPQTPHLMSAAFALQQPPPSPTNDCPDQSSSAVPPPTTCGTAGVSGGDFQLLGFIVLSLTEWETKIPKHI